MAIMNNPDNKPRIIIDTNILISYIITSNPTIIQVVDGAVLCCQFLASQETFDEFVSTINRDKFKKYIANKDSITNFTNKYINIIEFVPILEHITHCRDPKDDKFLELAANGRAKYFVTGDADLLILDSFRDTVIISPDKFLTTFPSPGGRWC